eukprot:2383945-Amphidinium_carterae.1
MRFKLGKRLLPDVHRLHNLTACTGDSEGSAGRQDQWKDLSLSVSTGASSSTEPPPAIPPRYSQSPSLLWPIDYGSAHVDVCSKATYGVTAHGFRQEILRRGRMDTTQIIPTL